MGVFSGLLKAGAAKKVFDEARKPHNQAKAKDLFRSVTGKGGDGGRGAGPGDTGPGTGGTGPGTGGTGPGTGGTGPGTGGTGPGTGGTDPGAGGSPRH